MKNSETNVFINIVKNEDANTELLKSFLQFKSFRDRFLELTNCQIDIDNISFDDFSTQTILLKNGRPDLVLKNKKLGIELFFEVKIINSNLTKNQPDGYIEELKESRSEIKGLFFVIPKFYHHRNKLSRIEYNIDNDNIKTKLIFWDDVINILEDISDFKNDQLFGHYLDYLRKRFHIYPIIYTPKEIETMFNSDTPTVLQKTSQLVYNANQTIRFPEGVNKRLMYNFPESYDYYISFTLPESQSEFIIGIWFDYWKKEGNPICFGVQMSSANDRENIEKLFREISKDLDFPEPIVFSENKNNPYLITYFKKEILMNEKFLDKVQEVSNHLIKLKN